MSRRTPRPNAIALLLDLLDEAYDRKAWHGPNLRGAIRGLSEKDASRRPAPGRHNAWELTLHAAYWKFVVRRRLTGDRSLAFPLSGSNWFPRPGGGSRWRDDVRLLADQHRLLRAVVAALPVSSLRSAAAGSRQTVGTLVRGIAEHDLYHAGQISLVRALTRPRGATGGRP